MAYFRTGYSLGDFLFKGFEVETAGAFAGVFIGLVSTAILFEGLRIVRDFLLNRFTDARKEFISSTLERSGGSVRYSRTIRNPREGHFSEQETHSLQPGHVSQHDQDDLEEDDEGVNRQGRLVTSAPTPYKCTTDPITDPLRKVRYEDLVLSTILHMIYISIGYILMLAVMTFNVWVLLAVSVGIAIGYFVFGTWRRTDHVALTCKTLITSNCREGSSEKTASTNSDSANSLDGKSKDRHRHQPSTAQVTADVDVHCSRLLET